MLFVFCFVVKECYISDRYQKNKKPLGISAKLLDQKSDWIALMILELAVVIIGDGLPILCLARIIYVECNPRQRVTTDATDHKRKALKLQKHVILSSTN